MWLCPKRYLQLPAAIFFYFTSVIGNAQSYLPASPVGTGGTGRATVGPGEALYLNPAVIPHLEGRNLLLSGKNNQRAYGVSDSSKDVSIPGALSWEEVKFDSGKHGTLSFSLAEFVNEKISFGLRAKYLETSLITNVRYAQTNVDFGLLWVLSPSLGLGVVHKNSFEAPKNVPKDLRQSPETAFGATYIYREFARFKLDVVSGPGHDGQKPTLGYGLETFFNDWLVFRLGHRNEQKVDKLSNSMGLGFYGPVFSVAWAYEADARRSGLYFHTIDLGVPF